MTAITSHSPSVGLTVDRSPATDLPARRTVRVYPPPWPCWA